MQINFKFINRFFSREFFDNRRVPLTVVSCAVCIACVFFGRPGLAQDSVDVKFFYKSTGNPTSVFLPGEFNNWGPNSSGTIAQNAPSRMTFDAALGQWTKTVRLRVGGHVGGGVAGAYQYKINENGASSGWRPDPLNPRRNAADNDNSILYVKNPAIHYLLPNSLSSVVDAQALTITAYVFPSTNTSVDTSSIRVVIDSTEYTHLGGAYDPATKKLSFAPGGQLLPGVHFLKLYANTVSGSKSGDSTTFVVIPPTVVEELPAGITDGINYLDNSTVTLSLYAPKKRFVAVIGDFNDWQVDPAYYMKRTPDSSRYWITVSNLQPQKEHLFQYYVDANLKIADPYAEKVLDQSNDPFISNTTYPDLIAYPSGKTQEIVSALQTDQQPYLWQVDDFQRPAPKDLVIYELLIRDFIARHDYTTMIDTLDYLDNLGINAIELMPINEFEGNISWGYNPSFYFAPDKYYGPKNDLKQFIDECHKRGIAVILDMVLNHSFGQSPFVRLFSSGTYGPPTAANPWYNITATHPFSVGYDFNHESAATKVLVDRVNAFWLNEYNVDGFRFDLSKGFTQRRSTDDSVFRLYDASRIAILKRMADEIWKVDSTAYVILEHFAENTEEKELSDYGMMLWGNLNIAYSQSAMGWLEDSGMPSDLFGGYYKTRGWSKPHLVTYMESHDEPWLMYKNLQFGRSSGSYNVKDLSTALNRIKLVAAFFLTLPGPKMIWQFGELGYDQNLPENGRTDPKLILWNYFTQPERRNLYKTYAALLKLRNENEVFRSADSQVAMRVGQGQYDRRINISHPSMNATIAGNFGVTTRDVNPNFQNTGMWYDYFSGDSISVTNTQAVMSLAPGEFHIYTTKKLEAPEPGIITAIEDDKPVLTPISFALRQNYPNPFNPETTIRFELPVAGHVSAKIFNLSGEEVATVVDRRMTAGTHLLKWQGVDAHGLQVGSGIYFLRVSAGNNVAVRKMMVVR